MEAVWRSLDAILDVLEILEGSNDGEMKTKSANLPNSVRNIGFICGIMLLKNVMFKTKMLSGYLQGETVDVADALAGAPWPGGGGGGRGPWPSLSSRPVGKLEI